ncbi:response regulator receiver domain [Granulicella sp. L60]|uniref:response regulator receiver domain n=1 Tax=Granulicella sp. L60 TaxID=1641866 RepID=UPI00131EC4EB|nr:response regulator receiver domain [Granulicella sp. L60]
MSGTVFAQHSNKIVQDFLSTVIVVDDQAFLDALERSAEPTEAKALKDPGRQAADKDETKLERVDAQPKPSAAPSEEPSSQSLTESSTASAHRLDGKQIIDKFGEFGIVCSVIRPDKDEIPKLNDVVRAFAPVADVFIFDWVLFGDTTGAKTKELIRELVTSSSDSHNGRARLIVVYTGELDLAQVATDISKELGSLNPQVTPDNFNIHLSGTGTRIAVYGKPSLNRTPEGTQRSLKPNEIPTAVIREFSEISRGLLSNAAMASITAIRRNAYQLLSRFPPDLDPAFVTQSILVCPERASEQIVPLIASEIGSILEDARIGDFLDTPPLKVWLEDRIARNASHPPADSDLSKEQYRNGFDQLLDLGIGKDELLIIQKNHGQFLTALHIGEKKKTAKILTNHLASSDFEKVGDSNLALLMSVRHMYEKAKPYLTLGTIISATRMQETVEVTDYWVCLQPVCDGVRLKAKRFFPLLPLTPSSETGESVIIVRDGAEVRLLLAKFNPFLIKMVEFAPIAQERVTAQERGATWSFTSIDGTEYKWISELKPSHAQRVAHQVSVAVSRIGLVESEWSRLAKPAS